MTHGVERKSRSYARRRGRQYTSVEVGTARRIGKALTNNPPYLVGGGAIVGYSRRLGRIYPRPAYILREMREGRDTGHTH